MLRGIVNRALVVDIQRLGAPLLVEAGPALLGRDLVVLAEPKGLVCELLFDLLNLSKLLIVIEILVLSWTVKLGPWLSSVPHLGPSPDRDVLHLLTEAQARGAVEERANGRALWLLVLLLFKLAAGFLRSLVVLGREVSIPWEASGWEVGILSLLQDLLVVVVRPVDRAHLSLALTTKRLLVGSVHGLWHAEQLLLLLTNLGVILLGLMPVHLK